MATTLKSIIQNFNSKKEGKEKSNIMEEIFNKSL